MRIIDRIRRRNQRPAPIITPASIIAATSLIDRAARLPDDQLPDDPQLKSCWLEIRDSESGYPIPADLWIHLDEITARTKAAEAARAARA
jgi:hypothetical protein